MFVDKYDASSLIAATQFSCPIICIGASNVAADDFEPCPDNVPREKLA